MARKSLQTHRNDIQLILRGSNKVAKDGSRWWPVVIEVVHIEKNTDDVSQSSTTLGAVEQSRLRDETLGVQPLHLDGTQEVGCGHLGRQEVRQREDHRVEDDVY